MTPTRSPRRSGSVPPSAHTGLQTSVHARARWGLLLLCLCGCGGATYQKRLEETAKLYQYLNTFEENLNPTLWQRADLGVSMRVPKPFQAPLPRAGARRENGEVIVGGEDPLGTPLPGQLDAWATVLGNSPAPNAYLYVASNHERLLATGVGDSSEGFFRDLEEAISNVYRVTIPKEEARQAAENSRYRLLAPPRNSPASSYSDSKDYVVLNYVGTGGRAAETSVYELKKGNVQVAVVLVLTERATPQTRQRMELALQTLDIQDLKPQRGGRGRMETPGAGTGGF